MKRTPTSHQALLAALCESNLLSERDREASIHYRFLGQSQLGYISPVERKQIVRGADGRLRVDSSQIIKRSEDERAKRRSSRKMRNLNRRKKR